VVKINNKPNKIQMTDGVLIPARDDTSIFSAWKITFCGAIILFALLLIISPNPYLDILITLPDGIFRTFQVTIVSIFFALIIGLLVGLGRISRNIIIDRICTVYVEIIRGIPLLVQIFYIYYALGFAKISGIIAAIIAIAICYGAYISEIFRAGIQSIPKGQMEAALALGFTRRQAIFKIILPQTVKVVLPPIGNEFIALLKDSSLVSVVAISDLLRRGREYASTTFEYFEVYTMVAIIYLIMTLFFSRLVAIMEERLRTDVKQG
jgi:polar amino acid transport system permease protein